MYVHHLFSLLLTYIMILPPLLVDIHPFDSLHTIMATGAVLTPPVMEWTQEAFGRETYLISSSGGTDICGACEQFVYIMTMDGTVN
jgi:acyl-coenzyme A synthetase/AMP-(fatty) acid ligase